MEACSWRTSALGEGAPDTQTAEAARSPGMPPGRSSWPPCRAGRFEPANATLPGHLPHGVARAFRYLPLRHGRTTFSGHPPSERHAARGAPQRQRAGFQPSPAPADPCRPAVRSHTSRTPRPATLLVLSGTRCPGRGARQLHIRRPAPILERWNAAVSAGGAGPVDLIVTTSLARSTQLLLCERVVWPALFFDARRSQITHLIRLRV